MGAVAGLAEKVHHTARTVRGAHRHQPPHSVPPCHFPYGRGGSGLLDHVGRAGGVQTREVVRRDTHFRNANERACVSRTPEVRNGPLHGAHDGVEGGQQESVSALHRCTCGHHSLQGLDGTGARVCCALGMWGGSLARMRGSRGDGLTGGGLGAKRAAGGLGRVRTVSREVEGVGGGRWSSFEPAGEVG